MMIKLRVLTCLACSFLLVAVAHTQEPVAVEKKIYRWIDKNGKVQISDQLPPEALDKERKEYNATSGSLSKTVSSQLTPAQRTLFEQQQREEKSMLEQAELAKRIEEGMLINYQTEDDLKRAFNEKTDVLKQTLVSLKASIQSRRASVIYSLNELADSELNGTALAPAKIKQVQENHALIARQITQYMRLNSSFASIQNEFALTLEKYRRMKADAQGVTAASSGNGLPVTGQEIQ